MIRAWNISANHALARGTSASNVRLVWPRDSATGVMISIAVAALTTFTRGGKRGGIGGQVALHALNGQDSRLLRLCARSVPGRQASSSHRQVPWMQCRPLLPLLLQAAAQSVWQEQQHKAESLSVAPIGLRDLLLKKLLIFQPKGPLQIRQIHQMLAKQGAAEEIVSEERECLEEVHISDVLSGNAETKIMPEAIAAKPQTPP